METRIIDAFERLMMREGVRAVGVNSLVKEAGIGKGLIYKYFGGLPGVVGAWAKRTKLLPDTLALLESEAFGALPTEQQHRHFITHYANAVRDSALMCDILSDELARPSDLTEALAEVRTRIGKEFATLFRVASRFDDVHDKALVTILVAAATYLAMRARTAPRFMGLDLSREEEWQEVLSMFDIIASSIALAKAAQDVQTQDAQAQDAQAQMPDQNT